MREEVGIDEHAVGWNEGGIVLKEEGGRNLGTGRILVRGVFIILLVSISFSWGMGCDVEDVHFAHNLALLYFLLLSRFLSCLLIYLQTRIALSDDSLDLREMSVLAAIDKQTCIRKTYSAKLASLLGGSHDL